MNMLKKKLQIRKRPKKLHDSSPSVNWIAVKQDYLTTNLNPQNEKPYSLAQLASTWDLNYGTVRNRASTEGWNEELNDQANKQSKEVIELAQKQYIYDEVDIRRRQADIAKFATAKAIERLRNLKVDELTPREAIELLRLGLVEERKALGMPDKYEFAAISDTDADFTIGKAEGLITQIINLIETKDGEYELPKDVEHE